MAQKQRPGAYRLLWNTRAIVGFHVRKPLLLIRVGFERGSVHGQEGHARRRQQGQGISEEHGSEDRVEEIKLVEILNTFNIDLDAHNEHIEKGIRAENEREENERERADYERLKEKFEA